MTAPGYQAQKVRTVLGVRLVQVTHGGGGWWKTEDNVWSFETWEGSEGGWSVDGPDLPRLVHVSSLKKAVRFMLSQPKPVTPEPEAPFSEGDDSPEDLASREAWDDSEPTEPQPRRFVGVGL